MPLISLWRTLQESKTAIWWAVERGRLDVVKYLLQFNPDVEVAGGEDDDSPLLLATKRKRVAIVYELIKYGAKLSSVDRVRRRCILRRSSSWSFRFSLQYGDNSLHIALRNHSRDIVDILLSNPRHSKYLYRPNKRGETPYKIDASLQKSILTTIFGQRMKDRLQRISLRSFSSVWSLQERWIWMMIRFLAMICIRLHWQKSWVNLLCGHPSQWWGEKWSSSALKCLRRLSRVCMPNGAVENQHCWHI